jgi:hypothetical protein
VSQAAGTADLRVDTGELAQKQPGGVNEVVTLDFPVYNDGPDDANNFRAVFHVSRGVIVDDVGSSGASCSSPTSDGIGGFSVTCTYPGFAPPAGFGVDFFVKVHASKAGTYAINGFATADESDPNPGNNSRTLYLVAGNGGSLPPPKPGKSVNVGVVKGQVSVDRPGGGSNFVPLGSEQIPVGSIVDTRNGTVRLTAAADHHGKTAHGDFNGSLFKVGQTHAKQPITTLDLRGGDFTGCTTHPRVAQLAKRKGRLLFGSAHGRFRTRGRHSSATVRGTKWSVEDRCDGTLTSVQTGVVEVNDFTRKRTVLVHAGHQYLALAK